MVTGIWLILSTLAYIVAGSTLPPAVFNLTGSVGLAIGCWSAITMLHFANVMLALRLNSQ